MAADEVLLARAAEQNEASLRFYGWTEPTLSLGYFQKAASRRAKPGLADVAWVRRPSGGAGILHHHELTYCLAIPSTSVWQGQENWICRFHHFTINALARFGVNARAVRCGEERLLGDALCFLHQTPGDLIIDGAKIAGSAQRKQRGAILQHGSILLRHSPHAPFLPGILELTGKEIVAFDLAEELVAVFREAMKCDLYHNDFKDDELVKIGDIKTNRYESVDWSMRR